jgi:hypothetical protein
MERLFFISEGGGLSSDCAFRELIPLFAYRSLGWLREGGRASGGVGAQSHGNGVHGKKGRERGILIWFNEAHRLRYDN